MIIKEHIQLVAEKGNSGDNTKFLIDFYETACESKGTEPTWDNIKAMMYIYKPESVVRKRREYIASTIKQREEEEKYHDCYMYDCPSMG